MDKTFGHATYGCGDCCPMDFLWANPDPIGLTVGVNGQDELWVEWSCTGQAWT